MTIELHIARKSVGSSFSKPEALGHTTGTPPNGSRPRTLRLARGLAVFWLTLGMAVSFCQADDVELATVLRDQPTGAVVRRLQLTTPAVEGWQRDASTQSIPQAAAARVDGGSLKPTTQAKPLSAVTLLAIHGPTLDPSDTNHASMAYQANDKWYGSTYWMGQERWARVGRDWQHPGDQTPSIRTFRAPRDGKLTVTGRVCKAHLDGDGVRVAIRHGDKTVWQAELEGRDGEGLQPEVPLTVRAGDPIRFVVDKRNKIFCDTTHWDPVISYDDGTTFKASEGFGDAECGRGCWRYEVDRNADSASPGLQLVTLDSQLQIHQYPLALGTQPTVLKQGDLLAALVVDPLSHSGVLVAPDCEVAWWLKAGVDAEGRLDFAVDLPVESNAKPTETVVELPGVVLASFAGSWLEGVGTLEQLLAAHQSEVGLQSLRNRLTEADTGDLALWLMVQKEWLHDDQIDGTGQVYLAAAKKHLQQTQLLLNDLRAAQGEGFLASERSALDALEKTLQDEATASEKADQIYLQVRRLKRRIVLANPLMNFGPMLFCKRVPTSYSHLVMQYYGWRARPGGGLFVLEQPGYSLKCRDILQGKLAKGNVLEPRLSYDGKRIVFSYVECPEKPLQPNEVDHTDPDVAYYHIYEVNVDGTGLRQITSGPFDDIMPTYLPDGGIAFCSTRRKGYARCFGGQFSRRWDVYTLHRVEADGSNLTTLSYHDTNEWFPTVSNTGHILYSRWDYIDRDAVTHQNLWSTRPDGTNPVAVWGNGSPKPHCTFQLQPIPNSSKVVFAASAHHSIAGGPIAIVDPTVSNDGQEAITRITPEIPFPEAETRDIREYYTAPWPLSEKYFLVGYSPVPLVWEPRPNPANALGLYVLDVFGNRELLHRDPDIGSTNPCPLQPRRMPPMLASMLPANAPEEGEMVLADVYEGLGDVPRGSIKALRVVQIFPKTTNVANSPPIGEAREENARAVLGTVPVEADGSARFTVPAKKLLLFQALDADGMAYQTMRTVTYVQPGETVSCVGCHEHRRTTPLRKPANLMALRHDPLPLDPGPFGGRPFSYVEVVQPVWDKHCVSCHAGEKPDGGMDLTGTPEKGFSRSYNALCKSDQSFWGAGTNPENARKALVPRFGGRNQIQVTPPGGMYGALGSRLIRLLREGHEGATLSDEEIRRIALWIDMNATFYGVYLPEQQQRQLHGELVEMPEIQ